VCAERVRSLMVFPLPVLVIDCGLTLPRAGPSIIWDGDHPQAQSGPGQMVSQACHPLPLHPNQQTKMHREAAAEPSTAQTAAAAAATQPAAAAAATPQPAAADSQKPSPDSHQGPTTPPTKRKKKRAQDNVKVHAAVTPQLQQQQQQLEGQHDRQQQQQQQLQQSDLSQAGTPAAAIAASVATTAVEAADEVPDLLPTELLQQLAESRKQQQQPLLRPQPQKARSTALIQVQDSTMSSTRCASQHAEGAREGGCAACSGSSSSSSVDRPAAASIREQLLGPTAAVGRVLRPAGTGSSRRRMWQH